MKRIYFLFQFLFLLPFFSICQNVGIGTSNPLSPLHVARGSILFNSDTGSIPVNGAGARFMWIPNKRALRAGQVTSTIWDDSFIGNYSTSFGFDAYASGFAANAFGYRTSAQSSYSLVAGYYNVIEGSMDTWVENDPLFVLGNGYTVPGSPPSIIRRNAFSVAKNGNTVIGGGLRLENNGEVNSGTGTANLLPIVYGNVSTGGGINSGTGNFTVEYDSTAIEYTISLGPYSSTGTIPIVTSNLPGAFGNAFYSGTNQIRIRLYLNNNRTPGNFFFVVYKP